MLTQLGSYLVQNWLDVCGTIAGLFYIWYQYHIDFRLWIASLVMSSFYVPLYLQLDYYAMAAIYVYYMIAAVYGLYAWRKKQAESGSQGGEGRLHHITPRLSALLLLVAVSLSGLLYAVLSRWGNPDTVLLDATTSALSVIGMWLIAKKVLEHWLIWIVVDGLNCIIFLLTGNYFSFALFALYAVVSVFGYAHWLRTMKQTA